MSKELLNILSFLFSVTVNSSPVITCPEPVSVRSLANNIGNVAMWNDPVCTDVDQPGVNINVTCTQVSGNFFPGVGTNIVTCTCIDNQGAVDTCTISVTITASLIGPTGTFSNRFVLFKFKFKFKFNLFPFCPPERY